MRILLVGLPEVIERKTTSQKTASDGHTVLVAVYTLISGYANVQSDGHLLSLKDML